MTAKDPFKVTKQNQYWIVTGIDKAVFTGDTIFIGGCGKFFEGTAPQMLVAMDIALTLPDDTKMFCGHEYTMSNFAFCAKAEGKSNPAISQFAEIYKNKLSEGFCTVPSLLGDEKQYNVFMRCRNVDLQNAIGESDPQKAMHILREWKNTGN